jgi:predicted metal-dependent phosphoesterase TrpH
MVHCRLLTKPSDAPPVTVTERAVRFGPADREPSPYAVVPFDVPTGTRAIRISLAYDHPAGASDAADGNILDLGLLGPGPTAVGRADFRGWSGSERTTVVVTDTAATPGYRPGKIEAGTWHVLLGLYRILPSGCTAEVRVEAFATPPSDLGELATRPARVASGAGRAPSIARTARSWLAVDLHAHTIHSDGSETIEALAARARDAGLNVLFVTDHNTDAHIGHLAAVAGIVLLPGEEVTTYKGHFNALGIRDWVEFRHTDAAGVARAIDLIHAQGALASINHPTSEGMPWRHGTDLDIDCMEVWNGPWSAEDDRAIEMFDAILDTDHRVVAVGGGDSHGPGPDEQPVGTPTTWVQADGTGLAAILDAIRSGRVVLSRDARTPPPGLDIALGGERWGIGDHAPRRDDLSARWWWDAAKPGVDSIPDEGVVHLLADGRIIGTTSLAHARSGSWPLPGSGIGRVRLEIRDAGDALVAMTNHVFIREATA